MDNQKNRCFIYHKNGIIQDVDDGLFCENINDKKVDILKNLKNQDLNRITYDGVVYQILDFWFTNISEENSYITEYHIKVS